MPVTQAQVVAKAREFISTLFAHQGRIKGRACDCVGLILMSADELHLKDTSGVLIHGSDNANYSAQPMSDFVHEECQRRMVEKPVSEMADGDVLTMRVPARDENIPTAAACHAAICSSVNGVRYIVHAYAPNGKVVENILDAKWRRRIAGCFRFAEVLS